MKLILLILTTFALAITALHAADPVIILTDNGTVTKDGVSHNNLADALLNKAITTREFADALKAWQAKLIAERDAAKAALNAKQQRIQEVLNSRLKAEQKQNAALNLRDGPRSKLLRELITEAETPERALKRQALEAEIVAKTKELEALK